MSSNDKSTVFRGAHAIKFMRTYTLVTGASTGLGKELAIECARRGMNLILIALPGRNLERLASAIRHCYNSDVIVFETDLAHDGAIELIASEVVGKYAVNFLINNAGIGGSSAFLDASDDFLEKIIRVNIRSTTMLTKAMLPELHKHRQAYILNVASIAAICPVAYKTIYPASKAFIYSFSRSLSYELRDVGISVSVVNPGAIITNFDTTRRLIEQGLKGRSSHLSAREVARISIEGTLKGKTVIVPGRANHLSQILIGLLPLKLRIALGSKIVKRELVNTKRIAA